MPGDRRLDQVIEAIVVALAADHGDGLDLSGAGRVLRGRYLEPPAVALPCAAVAGPAVRGQRGHALTSWSYACTVDVVVWAAPTAVTTEGQVLRGEQILDAIAYALTSASDTNGNPLRALPDLQLDLEVAADLEGGTDVACVTCTIGFTLHRLAARGVSR